jgi:hypothetical protein
MKPAPAERLGARISGVAFSSDGFSPHVPELPGIHHQQRSHLPLLQ